MSPSMAESFMANIKSLSKCLLSPFMLLMFLGASCRHSAGFTWAYNCRLYFLSYYPDNDVGTYFTFSAIIGGASAVIIGGAIADKLAYKRVPDLAFDHESQIKGCRIRLYVLGFCMVFNRQTNCCLNLVFQLLSSPFAVGVLALQPPLAFFCLFGYYLLGISFICILFKAHNSLQRRPGLVSYL